MFERQIQHYLMLAALLIGVGIAVTLSGDLLAGRLAGISTGSWLALAIVVPILHQVYVWFAWRLELHHGSIGKWFGRQKGFTYYSVGFAILIVSRPLAVILLAISNRNTLDLSAAVGYALALVLLAPWLYLAYSVHRYFGIRRALGIDHFDASYRQVPFVRRGIFRFTPNGMYTFGFFVLWIPGLIWLSQAALLAALFNHLYIWVHYYCTELPDIYRIYGRDAK